MSGYVLGIRATIGGVLPHFAVRDEDSLIGAVMAGHDAAGVRESGDHGDDGCDLPGACCGIPF